MKRVSFAMAVILFALNPLVPARCRAVTNVVHFSFQYTDPSAGGQTCDGWFSLDSSVLPSPGGWVTPLLAPWYLSFTFGGHAFTPSDTRLYLHSDTSGRLDIWSLASNNLSHAAPGFVLDAYADWGGHDYGLIEPSVWTTGTATMRGRGTWTLSTASQLAVIDLDPQRINPASRGRWLTATIELPQLNPQDIELATVRLAGSIPADPKFGEVGDRDRDGSPDLMVKFSLPALGALLVPGVNTLEVTGQLTTGEAFRGTAEVTVLDVKREALSVSIAPNPLNPSGTLTFRSQAAGVVRLSLFDLRGRRVRTLIEDRFMAPGLHTARVDGRGEGGEELASGVYFYRLETPAGRETGRFTILK